MKPQAERDFIWYNIYFKAFTSRNKLIFNLVNNVIMT